MNKLPGEILLRILAFINDDLDSENYWLAVNGDKCWDQYEKEILKIARYQESYYPEIPVVDSFPRRVDEMAAHYSETFHAMSERTRRQYALLQEAPLHEVMDMCSSQLESLHVGLHYWTQEYYTEVGHYTKDSFWYETMPAHTKACVRRDLIVFHKWLQMLQALLKIPLK